MGSWARDNGCGCKAALSERFLGRACLIQGEALGLGHREVLSGHFTVGASRSPNMAGLKCENPLSISRLCRADYAERLVGSYVGPDLDTFDSAYDLLA